MNNLTKFLTLFLMVILVTGCPKKRPVDDENYGSEDSSSTYNAVDASNVSGSAGGSGGISPHNKLAQVFYFDYDSSKLKPEAMQALDQHAKQLISSKASITLIGHTDERGTHEYNMALGERRAKAVHSYLSLKGVPSNRMSVVSYGKELPIATGSNEAAWAQNRRVELFK